MEHNNERLRGRFPDFSFSEMPDPKLDPEKIVARKRSLRLAKYRYSI
jgi:hypothetical protein